MAGLHLMKTQLKLELNMKKTLLARVVKGIAVCGLAMSSISYAATSVNAVHNVVVNRPGYPGD